MVGLGLTLDGERPPFEIQVLEKGIARAAPITRLSSNVPGLAGAHPNGYETGKRPLNPLIDFDANSHDEWLDKYDILIGWLIRDDPAPLIFDDEPGRTYLAEFEGAAQTKELNTYGKVQLNFICADPYIYGDTNINLFKNGKTIAYNAGTVDAAPVYEIEVLDDITHLDIISDSAYLRLGQPAQIGKPIYEWRRLILHDTMKTLLPWSDAVNVDNGYVAGTMVATQAGFRAELFGAAETPEAWQGPSKRRSLPEPIKNFQIDILIDFLNFTKETGMIEIYLLDAFSNTVAKIGFEDVWPTVRRSQFKFQLGNVNERKIEHHYSAKNWSVWNDFTGLIRLVRRENVYVPYVAYIGSDGVHKYRYVNYSYTDSSGTYGAEVTQIQVAIRKWPGGIESEADMTIKDIKIWEFDDQPEGVRVMAKAEDKIIIDAKEGNVLLNGEVQEDLADWFGDYFDLPPGKTPLVIQPAEKINAKVIVRERFR